MNEACKYCRFAKRAGEYGFQCLRFPPTVAFQAALDGSGNIYYENMRPFVAPDEWCGEFTKSECEAVDVHPGNEVFTDSPRPVEKALLAGASDNLLLAGINP